MTTRICDVLIVGGGTGGVAAALALQDKGLRVIMTEPSDWIGGQFTSQAVPPDEHRWIETCGCTARYRALRAGVRDWYRREGDLTTEAQRALFLNPGGGWVSHLCAMPQVWHLVLDSWLSEGPVEILLGVRPVEANMSGSRVESVTFQDQSGEMLKVSAAYVLDATEIGDLLPMTGTAYRVGAESKSETGEPNALDGEAEPDNIQGFTWCGLLGWDADPAADHTIEKPLDYEFWRDYEPPNWPGKLLSFTFLNVRTGEPQHFPLFGNDGFNLFSYRQVYDPLLHRNGGDAVTSLNWPMNDYLCGHVIDVEPQVEAERLEASRNLTKSLVYWLQTECGYKGLYLSRDAAGTDDGLAKAPYHREGRRLKALTTITEQDVATVCHPGSLLAPQFEDSIGVGAYRIDLHPASNGAKTIDTSTLPFTIPLGALIPQETTNLIAAGKCLGTTHITNGCYRLHPIEWNVGEVAGLLANHCLENDVDPAEVWLNKSKLAEFQAKVQSEGIATAWPEFGPL